MRRGWAWCVGVGLSALFAAWVAFGRSVERRYREPGTGRDYSVITRAYHARQRPAPVLFVLHAYASAPELAVRGHYLQTLAVLQRGFVMVIPEGRKNAKGHFFWNATRACCADDPGQPNDVQYLHGVLQDVKRRVAIDPARVWALGVSNGGFMAYRWACSGLSDLTGLVSVSGAGLSAEDPPCTPTNVKRVLQVHGDADALVRYQGGQMRGHTHPSALASLRPFLTRAGITTPPHFSRERSPSLEAIHKREWSKGDTRVALWTIQGGGHQLRGAQLATPWILAFLEN